ncbi:MAG: hypothetical protein HQ478_14425 [Chloroflexi bacterium]|nr:hypothetical protein [Chloroflexota bacterium]
MSWDYGVDLGAIVGHVESSETFSVFFPSLRKALVVDMRHGPEEGPMVRVLPMARSPQERLRSLRRLRPHLPRATQMVAIPWPSYVANIVRSGVWDKLAERISESGSEDAVRALAHSLAELRQHESSELATLIRGDHYETIWSRSE